MNQGRGKRQIENSHKITGWSLIALLVSLIFIFIQA